MDASRLTLTDYQYNIYNEYLDQVDDMLVKYGKQTGLSIQYWHIKVDLSKNYDDLKIQNANKHFVYDLFHFVPTIDMSPLTYQIGEDRTRQGLTNLATGTMSIYLLEQPLPGDMFRYYPANGATDGTEIFRVINVRYMRTSKNKLSLYQLDFETAPILLDTLNHVRINSIWCWDTENFLFLNEVQCNAMEEIQERRDDLIDEINKYYDPVNGWYGRCFAEPGAGLQCTDSITRPLIFLNTILKRLKRLFNAMNIKPMFGVGTAKIPINWILNPNPDDDYWDTFTCLSMNPEANAGEIFNVTQILAGECATCPEEFVLELECHRELIELVLELALLMEPLITTEQLEDRTCDRKCCDVYDPNYIKQCLTGNQVNFGDLFWDSEGAAAGEAHSGFCDKYENAVCVPLYISWRSGAIWPDGGLTE